MAQSAKGNADISINPRETEARLVFTPVSDGSTWDAAALVKLVAQMRVSPLPDAKALESLLLKAAKTETPLELVVARGVEPEETLGETVNWEPLPIPKEMASFMKEVVASSSAPRLFRTSVEKVKHEEKVTKGGLLPFTQAKEKTVVSWEKRETTEEVKVDPRIIEVLYAERGAKLGTVMPPVPGKAGKSIYGKTIPPPQSGETAYLLGEGIDRIKNELYALVSGFLKIGENWADIVPFSKPVWNINTGSDGHTLFFRFEGGDARFPLPAAKTILAAAAKKGARQENLISAEELDEAIAESMRTGEALEAFSLFRSQEAVARVDISPDKTRAVLYLRKALAGAIPLDMKTISQVIKESEVHSFNPEKLRYTIQEFMADSDLELRDYVLAEGRQSVRGKDRELEMVVAMPSPEEQKMILSRLKASKSQKAATEDDFDYHDVTGLVFVKKNMIIAKLGAESRGEPGKDVFGEEIPGLPGNDPQIKLQGGLALRGHQIIALQDGLLLFFEASNKSFRGRVIDYQDAKIGIHISENIMEARGDFFREKGLGVPLTFENVKKVLAVLGVKRGIDWKSVEEACALARSKGSVLGHLLARGEAPVAPGAYAITWLIPQKQQKENDSDEETISVHVKTGDPVVDLSEQMPLGRAGYDIKGKEIPISSAERQTIQHDSSIQVMKYGTGRRLVAARSGELLIKNNDLKIVSGKTIEGDVGPNTGNLNFPGEIKIKGNVLSGCAVVGDSHVIVDGVVYEALVSAGGKVEAVLGIKGGGRAVIRARAGIESDFTERASIMAVGDIRLKRGAIHSHIKTNGKLHISGDNGKLTGGDCHARFGVDAADIGSDKHTLTEISFGQDYLIKDKIGAAEEEIAKIKQETTALEDVIQKNIAAGISISEETKEKKIRLVKLLEQLKLKLLNLREKYEEHHESQVRVRGTVFPGVILESHDRYYEIKQKRHSVIFYFDREAGRIMEKTLDTFDFSLDDFTFEFD